MDDLIAQGKGKGRKSNNSASAAKSKAVKTPSIVGRSVGIDLGTTYSSIAMVEGGVPQIIPAEGVRITPSVVGYVAGDENDNKRSLLVRKRDANYWLIQKHICKRQESYWKDGRRGEEEK